MMRRDGRTRGVGNPEGRAVRTSANVFRGQDFRRAMFITCAYGILETSAKKFSCARAGHEPILVAHPENTIDVLMPSLAAADADHRTDLGGETIGVGPVVLGDRTRIGPGAKKTADDSSA